MSNFIGIDLGTTYCAVATIDETGRPQVICNSDGSNLTASCVEFRSDGGHDVGEAARRAMFLPGSHAVGRFKRSMGEDKTYDVGGASYTPTALSSLVLRHLLDDVKRVIGEVGQAVVTIPANFAHEAREATLQAAENAGLDVQFIINEPTAAALFYAFSAGTEFGGKYAVYDLGGGTFDISIIQVDGQDVEVLASNGVARLGGDDFDSALCKLVQDKYAAETGMTLEPADFTKNDAEEEKKSLSRRDRVVSRVSRHTVTITRDEFEESISTLVAQAEMLCEATMDEAGVDPSELAGVLLAGGSTRIPFVQQSIRRVFRQDPTSTANVDEVVAMGAALYAAYKGDRSKLSPTQATAIEKIKIREATGMSFGTLSIGVNSARGHAALVNSILIKKGQPIPCSVTESFYTVTPDQRGVNCVVTESRAPESDPRFVKVIWEGDLPLPAGRPENQEIAITFSYDENQVMTCSFVDVATGTEKRIDLSVQAQVTDDESVKKFLVE
jgi:molecular chaperone DnaK